MKLLEWASENPGMAIIAAIFFIVLLTTILNFILRLAGKDQITDED